MTDPYRQHHVDGMIDSLSAELEKVKAELVVSKNKVKELETTIDEERTAINDGWEYKLVSIPHTFVNEGTSAGSSNHAISLQGMLTIHEQPWMKGRKPDAYIVKYENFVCGTLEKLGKQGFEMFHQDEHNKEIYWFRRKIKTQ